MAEPPDTELTISDSEVYARLSSILCDSEDFGKMSSECLQIGKEYLGVENGHITRIEPTAAYWEIIGSSSPSDSEYPVGLSVDLEKTFCRKTIEREETIALHEAGNQGWGNDQAYSKHELETYLGTPYTVNEQSYGTVCFVSSDARPRAFGRKEIAFVEFLADLISRILTQRRQEEIIEEKQWVISTLSRVLRHNLSNDLNVVHGHAEMLELKSDGSLEEHIEAIKTNSEELMGLAEKARDLQSLVNADYNRSPMQLDNLIRSQISTVQESYPDAEFDVECLPEMTVHVLPSLEMAVVELLENAAKHSGNSPLVDITASRSERSFSIEISDNGGGLPELELQVLKEGTETPLAHGSGLGLWMVHWVVLRHNGTIDATVTDTGTQIEMKIPYGMAKIPSEIGSSLATSE